MKDGRCPRCGSVNVRKQCNGLHADGWKMRMPLWPNRVDEVTDVVTYLCVSCGYFENYVLGKGRLSQAAQRWVRVEASG